MAEHETTQFGAARGHGVTLQPKSDFRLIHRNYGNTLVRIGGQYYPRKTLTLAISEAMLMMTSLLMATLVRFPHFAAFQSFLSDRSNWYRFIAVVAVCQLSLYYNELYDMRTTRNPLVLAIHMVRALATSFLALAMLYYLVPNIRLERGILALAGPFALILLITWRLGAHSNTGSARALERVLIVGTGASAAILTREILSRPELQYKIVGFLDERGKNIGRPLVNPGIIGAISQLEEIVDMESIDRVVISLDERRGVLPFQTMATLRLQGLPIEDAQSMYERLTGRIMTEKLRPSTLILSDGFNKSRMLLAGKRAIDLVISFVLTVLTLPVMAVVALAILLEDGRPVFFRQTRIGLGGRTFQILKFRSMQHGSERGKPRWATDGDTRVTRVGRWIRKFRLDELPQFINILQGDMSLIGPRPEVPYFCELLEKEIPFFNQRHVVRPGLTGWAQVKYRYGASLEEAKTKFEFDLFYIKRLSLMLDLTIIFETAKVVFWGRGGR
ncbi:MAG TPA: TIGR03013 family XrtA/PEP-CTERM system glycosyltransferase [Candidatus Angelobacter sp.]|nr:TIGR03013 family XrtA/PEP-CTERM system glycosyltransferase [Candidatus Angelobacter sp.]